MTEERCENCNDKTKVMEDVRNLIDEYIRKEDELKKIYADLKDKLLNKLINILLWENENLNAKHDIGCKGVSYYYTLRFEKDYIEFVVESSWAYGGHDVECHNISYDKIFSDDWKEKSLLNYQKNKRKTVSEMACIDTKYLFKCDTCRYMRSGKCTTFCDSGECYSPSFSKIPTADVVEVETIKAWLYEMAINNVDCVINGDFSNACEEIIARLDGLRNFSKERSE